jgi:hypothetical protein
MSHIVIVPACVLAPSTQAELVALILPDDIERHLAQQRKGSRCHFIATATIVFPESDIQHPMQTIFNRPVAAHSLNQNLGHITATGQVIADVGLGFIAMRDAADGFYRQDIANPELWSNLVYRESSGILLLISGLFNAVDEFHAGNNLG